MIALSLPENFNSLDRVSIHPLVQRSYRSVKPTQTPPSWEFQECQLSKPEFPWNVAMPSHLFVVRLLLCHEDRVEWLQHRPCGPQSSKCYYLDLYRTCRPVFCTTHLFLNPAQYAVNDMASCARRVAPVSVPSFLSCVVLEKLLVLSEVLRVFLGGMGLK